MNLHEQLGALETGVDQLIQAVVATQADNTSKECGTQEPAATQNAQSQPDHVASEAQAEGAANVEPTAATAATETAAAEPEAGPKPQPTLEINRPAQNEITMTIGGQTVALRPEQIGKLIEELSNARASMTPEPPPGIPSGWRFVSTKNPVMAVQKQSNGDRLLVMRHTGHGWVPFSFSPDMVIQLYMMLTK